MFFSGEKLLGNMAGFFHPQKIYRIFPAKMKIGFKLTPFLLQDIGQIVLQIGKTIETKVLAKTHNRRIRHVAGMSHFFELQARIAFSGQKIIGNGGVGGIFAFRHGLKLIFQIHSTLLLLCNGLNGGPNE